MAPEISLALLAPLYGGPWLLIFGFLRLPEPSGERAAWRALWAPVALPAVLTALLVGFGLEELSDVFSPAPEGPEAGLFAPAVWLALPFSLIWGRAVVRAVASALLPLPRLAAATTGLLRPRIEIAAEFEAGLSPAERLAVRAHERAHVRHRDPLRIWLAQLATDLQWPAPQAARRLARWREELELARDDDARRDGAEEVALASALVAAARYALIPTTAAPVAAMAVPADLLRRRVGRLLGGSPCPSVEAGGGRVLLAALSIGLLTVGALAGDAIFRLLPGVGG